MRWPPYHGNDVGIASCGREYTGVLGICMHIRGSFSLRYGLREQFISLIFHKNPNINHKYLCIAASFCQRVCQLP